MLRKNPDDHNLNFFIHFPGVVFITLACLVLPGCIPYDSSVKTYKQPYSVDFSYDKEASANAYAISNQQSRVVIKVYRAGRLANLGHNHIIIVDNLYGIINLPSEGNQNLTNTQVELAFPVSQLIIDNTYERTHSGEDFKKNISLKDIQATRNNLLGKSLLMANQFPMIELEINKVIGTLPTLVFETLIKVRNHQSTQLISAQTSISKNQITASGSFSIKQTELGLTPFSLFGGAIAVKDKIDIEFLLIANKLSNQNSG